MSFMGSNRRPASRPACGECASSGECFIGNLPEPARLRVIPLVSEQVFAKGDWLQRQGERARHVGVVKLGPTMLLRSGRDGPPCPLGLFGSGLLLGLCDLARQPNVLSCQAVSAGRACMLELELIQQHDLLNRTLLTQVMAAHMRSHARLAYWAQVVRVRSAPGRVAAALLELIDVQHSCQVRLPSYQNLADILGMRRETIVRALATLEKQYALVRHGRTYCEIDRDRLLASMDMDLTEEGGRTE